MNSATDFTKWQETKQDTARHLQVFFRDTLVNPLPYNKQTEQMKVCSVFVITILYRYKRYCQRRYRSNF